MKNSFHFIIIFLLAFAKPCLAQNESLKTKYDTLIPIFDGLFITYDKIDTNSFKRYSRVNNLRWLGRQHEANEIKKWGVIDSLGKIVVPFICDGIKAITDSKGIISVYSYGHFLNTRVGRCKYYGITYFFTSCDGIMNHTYYEFSEKIKGMNSKDSINIFDSNPERYLPKVYRKSYKAYSIKK